MPKKPSVFLALLILSIFLSPLPSSAAAKEGSKCSSVGKISGKLTCVSLDGSKFWYELTLAKGSKKYAQLKSDCYRENMMTKGYDENKKLIDLICKYPTSAKGPDFPKWAFSPTNSSKNPNSDFSNICNPDPLVPKEWADVQEWERTTGYVCPTFYRYVTQNDSTTPKTKLIFDNLSVDKCKLSNNSARPSGFPRNPSLMNWSKSAVIQVVPVQFSDYQTNENPQIIYNKYFKYINDFLVNASDLPVRPEIRVPNKYFKLNGSLISYDLEGFSANPFVSDLVQATDSEINYSGVDQILVVVPPTIPLKEYFSGGLPWGEINTQKGRIKGMWIAGPISRDVRYSDSYSTSTSPWIWIHEFVGHTAGLNDAGGNLYEKDGNPILDVGMGGWGAMNAMKGDFVIWDKWLMGFVSDDQIACANTNGTYINWISPNTLKSNKTKAIVVPISNNKAIFIESQRSIGYNFKLPKSCNGVLVYSVDSSVTVNQKASKLHNLKEPFTEFQCNATLKIYDEIIVDGYKIKVLEAGIFGDVVKVEKVA